MSASTILFLNFGIHSLVLGAAGWLLVRCCIRDALRRCLLANLALLFCLIGPFHIFMQDILPAQQTVPVWTPLRETFEADWRVTVEPEPPAPLPAVKSAPPAPRWNVNDVVRALRRTVWSGIVILLGRVLVQSIRVQRWAWRLRRPGAKEHAALPADLDLSRMRVSDDATTPCVAGWFPPVIAVPASAFHELTPTQWRWLMRHEGEHLRSHDTAAVLLQHIIRAFLWWNPFVHALVEDYARAREEACDAAALGGKNEHANYAEFLLAWAEKPSSLPACVMPMAQSLPARRLKARLTALMEARGVRQKVGALFVLVCLVFAFMAPLLAASFGLATAAAQEVKAARADDGKLHTRVYRVAPDFLSSGLVVKDPFASPQPAAGHVPSPTARELLQKSGVPFPEGASALFQPTTSQLIVRNTLTNMALIERVVDAVNFRPVQVYFTCRLIQADRFLGVHESILSPEEVQTLIRGASQKEGIHLMSAPSVTTKFNQAATIEVVREVPPKRLPDGKLSGDLKLVGPRLRLNAKSPVEGKSTVAVEAELGVDLDSDETLLPKNRPTDWDRVRVHAVASQALLASGQTLLLRLQTAKKPVTVLITVQALRPDGSNAASFAENTGVAPPAREGREVPKEQSDTKFTRVYRVPPDFGAGQKPVDYLEANGIDFPAGAEAALEDQHLTVRNTKRNLDLIEALLAARMDSMLQTKAQIKLVVHAADMKADIDGLTKLLFPSVKREPANAPVSDAFRHQFTAQGILTGPQFQVVLRNLEKGGFKASPLPEESVKNREEAVFDLSSEEGASQLKVTPAIGTDGHTIDLMVRAAVPAPGGARAITTAVTLWDGQTLILSGQPSNQEGMTRLIFISALLVDPAGKSKDK